MTTTSRIPAVRTALVAALKASLPNAVVFNGPFVTVPDGDYVAVGWTPEGDRAGATQSWAGLGNKARDEQIDVPCYCDSYSGSTNWPARIDAAYTLLAAAENALRADPTLGGAIPNPGWAQISSYTEFDEGNPQGTYVGIVFHVVANTRI